MYDNLASTISKVLSLTEPERFLEDREIIVTTIYNKFYCKKTNISSSDQASSGALVFDQDSDTCLFWRIEEQKRRPISCLNVSLDEIQNSSDKWVSNVNNSELFYTLIPIEKRHILLNRFYFNIGYENRFDFFLNLIKMLSFYRQIFNIKIFPFDRQRCDNIVLYANPHDCDRIFLLLNEYLSVMSKNSLTSLPLFTHRILPGVSFAESPDKNRSFGMHISNFLYSVSLSYIQTEYTNLEGIIRDKLIEHNISSNALHRRRDSFRTFLFL